MDEKKKTPGTGRGTGRRPGSKNKISTEVKQDIAEFFRTCTSENIRWRQNMRRKLEMAATSREFFNLSRLALSYAHGLPGKMQDTTKPRESLVFLTTNDRRGRPKGTTVSPAEEWRDLVSAAMESLRTARRPAPVAAASSPKATLEPAAPRTEPQREQPATARPCSRCGTEPRAGTSGWGRRCIRDKMRATRAAPGYTAPPRKRRSKVFAVNTVAASVAHRSSRTEDIVNAARSAARAKLAALRAAEFTRP